MHSFSPEKSWSVTKIVARNDLIVKSVNAKQASVQQVPLISSALIVLSHFFESKSGTDL